jgi:dienelactone hydrolase
MAFQSSTVEYFDNGICLEGLFVYDDSLTQPLPTVLIAHAWGGRDEFVCDKARRVAELGYGAFALDMYGKGVLGSSVEENVALMTPFMEDRAMLQRRIGAALDAVSGLDSVDAGLIVAMGFCFGGLCVLDLARTGADLCGVVSFHGLLAAPSNIEGQPINARVLVLHGHDDPMVPMEDIARLQEDLTRAGCDWQFHSYGKTMHAFTNPVANDPGFGTVYHPLADRRSWQTMQMFFEECFDDR